MLHELIDIVSELGRFTEDRRAELHAKLGQAGAPVTQDPAAASYGSLLARTDVPPGT